MLDDTTERDRLKKVVCEIHGQYAGLSPEEAENEFLQVANFCGQTWVVLDMTFDFF